MNKLDNFIFDYLRSDEFQSKLHEDFSHVDFPVSFAYAIERLIVLHVKMYMMEDKARNEELANDQIGLLKRRIDQLNGTSRPRLIEALGDILAKSIQEANSELIREDSTKQYGK